MNLAAIRAELENEQTWRRDEIRFLHNQLGHMPSASEQEQFRRALVVMLYAHYEGFCRFALLQYVKAVNQAAIMCAEATPAIVAGAWSKMFTAMENGDRKSTIFRNQLPDDTQLHRFARRRDFIEQFADFAKQTTEISEDTIDMESNLRPIVMRKNLYLLGLDHEVFSHHDGMISQLLNRRNRIAHGADRDGFAAQEYAQLESAVFKIMDDLMDIIMEALQRENYRR